MSSPKRHVFIALLFILKCYCYCYYIVTTVVVVVVIVIVTVIAVIVIVIVVVIVFVSVTKFYDKAFHRRTLKLCYLLHLFSSLKIDHSSNRRLKGHATVSVKNVF